ncbi:MAG: flagellar hook-associated protein 3, partial [Betaproteobacteria bacterium]|nr:flagellar hook-associated protein 3 [Betaproteobacteria bacterium]
GTRRGMTEVDVLQDGISHAIAEIGANRNVIEQQRQVIDATKLRLQSTLSGIKDTDYTEAVTRLQREMLALQAGQSSFAQTARLNLFEYIK